MPLLYSLRLIHPLRLIQTKFIIIGKKKPPKKAGDLLMLIHLYAMQQTKLSSYFTNYQICANSSNMLQSQRI